MRFPGVGFWFVGGCPQRSYWRNPEHIIHLMFVDVIEKLVPQRRKTQTPRHSDPGTLWSETDPVIGNGFGIEIMGSMTLAGSLWSETASESKSREGPGRYDILGFQSLCLNFKWMHCWFHFRILCTRSRGDPGRVPRQKTYNIYFIYKI